MKTDSTYCFGNTQFLKECKKCGRLLAEDDDLEDKHVTYIRAKKDEKECESFMAEVPK